MLKIALQKSEKGTVHVTTSKLRSQRRDTGLHCKDVLVLVVTDVVEHLMWPIFLRHHT